MTSIIRNWFGRSGNNIIQLINCIHYTFFIQKGEKIVFPKHTLLNSRCIESLEEIKKIKGKFRDKCDFFYAKKLGFTLSPKQMREIAQKYLVPIMNLNLHLKDEENSISIHLRGGDTMVQNTQKQILSPWKYYKKVLDEYKYDHINIIHEDKLNSCIEKFKEIENVYFQSLSVKEDVQKMCKAKHFMLSYSTFDLIVFFISTNLERIYLPKYLADYWYPELDWGMEKIIVDFKNYDSNLWLGKSLEQKRKFLIDYDGEMEFI